MDENKIISNNQLMYSLLISVKNPHEALDALSGGASWIDVKEPANGPLGRATFETIANVSAFVRGHSFISAAGGELSEYPLVLNNLDNFHRYSVIKFGTSMLTEASIACNALTAIRHTLPYGISIALAGYVDHLRSNSPPPKSIISICADIGCKYFLLDTYIKDRSSLFDWLEPALLQEIREKTSQNNIKLILAGSLQINDVEKIRQINPDVVAIRGAACLRCDRNSNIDRAKVRQWHQKLLGWL